MIFLHGEARAGAMKGPCASRSASFYFGVLGVDSGGTLSYLARTLTERYTVTIDKLNAGSLD